MYVQLPEATRPGQAEYQLRQCSTLALLQRDAPRRNKLGRAAGVSVGTTYLESGSFRVIPSRAPPQVMGARVIGGVITQFEDSQRKIRH